MKATTLILVAAFWALPVDAAVHHSSTLGWKAGQDVTEAFARLLETGTLKAGDELVLDHTYKIIGCHMAGGHWSNYLEGNKTMVYRRCLIEKTQGDAIKIGGNGNPMRNALFENCVFQDDLRDGIDSTGGINESVVRNCTFRRMGVSDMDMKSGYDLNKGRLSKADLVPENVGIRIVNCMFHDMKHGIILTTIDGGHRKGEALLNAGNIKKSARHDIDGIDCTFGYVEPIPDRRGEGGSGAEKRLRRSHGGFYGVHNPTPQGEHMRMIHLKDAHSIRYTNARLFGDRIIPYAIDSIGGSRYLSKEAADALERTIEGNVIVMSGPSVEPGVTKVPFACGPQPRE